MALVGFLSLGFFIILGWFLITPKCPKCGTKMIVTVRDEPLMEIQSLPFCPTCKDFIMKRNK